MKHKGQANKRQGYRNKAASPEMQGWHLAGQPKAVMEANEAAPFPNNQIRS